MILPRTGEGLPPWRRKVSTWVMGTLRLGLAWFLTREQVGMLADDTSLFLSDMMPAWLRWVTAAALVVGALLFTWSRTVLVGFVLLAVALGVFEWYWQMIGMPGGSTYGWSVGVLAVLAGGEWLVQRVQRRLYAPPPQA